MAIMTSKELYLSVKDKIKIATLNGDEFNSDEEFNENNVNALTDKEFLEEADKRDTVYTLSDFIEKFNCTYMETISSENTYIRII